ncbi:MAG: ankyrin repeat domain-containing protein [Rhodocyclales bacterium]|nr:ankyrin repeat domain-containing protein [Rhodocyclales bacterium]
MRYALSLLAVLVCLLRPAWAAPPVPPTPLQFGVAVEAGNTWAVKEWLAEGLPPDYLADRIGSGLMIGAWIGNLDIMELFHARGADVNLMNRHGERALQLAAWRGHADAVRWLLARGAEVNRADKQWGALHYAAFAGRADIARLLIEKGADVNARTPNDSTALMMAAREGQADIARTLLEAGADTAPINEWGDSALAFAMRNRNYGIAKMVSNAEEFARAVKAPEAFGEAKKSVPAPPEISEIVEKMRQAQAEGKPTDALRKALYAALALHRHDSEVSTLKTQKGKGGKPEVLVITAERKQAGRERAELLYEAVKAGAAVTTPAQAAGGADAPSEISGILDRLQKEQGRKGKKRSAAELRKELHDAVTRFKQDAQPEAAK